MGKMLGIRPPSNGNRTEAGSVQSGANAWARHNLHKREAKLFELLRRLGKGSPDNRKKTAIEIAKIAYLADSPRAKEALSERIENEKIAFVRAHLLRIISAMAKSGADCKEFLPQIKMILREGTDFEKMESANALRHIGDRASVPPLSEALEAGKGLYPPAKRAIREAIDSLKGPEEGSQDSSSEQG